MRAGSFLRGSAPARATKLDRPDKPGDDEWGDKPVKIVAIDRNGAEHVVEGRDGWSVMEILRDAGLPIAAECGGACACATCHVYVEDGWYEKLSPPSDAEIDMLDMALAVQPNSRLSCQITCSDALDGIKVTVAPE